MRWVRLTDERLGPLIRFLCLREAGCVSFTERLHRDRRIAMPPQRECSVVIRVDAARTITGAILQNLNGVYYPVLDSTRPFVEPEAVGRLFRSSRRVFSILGRASDVTALEAAFPHPPRQYLEYHLMSQVEPPPEPSLPLLPREMTVRRVTSDDAGWLFDIQKEYEIEEVLLPGNRFHAGATLDHLRRTIRDQIVLVAEVDGRPIGKVNTNARGIFFDQVGGMFTDRSLRSRGVGTALMLRLLQRIGEEHKNASLFVKKDNAPALRLYRGIGFAIEDEFRISYYG